MMAQKPTRKPDELGARMKGDRCGKRPERYYPARQTDAPGFARSF